MPTGVPGLDAAYRKAIKQEPLSRGHMDPLAINSFNKSFMQVTYTLTDAVPQYVASNSGPRQTFEAKIRSYAKESCGSRTRQGTLYLLTGTSEFSLTSYRKQETCAGFQRKAILGGDVTRRNDDDTCCSSSRLDSWLLCVERIHLGIWKGEKGGIFYGDE